MQETSLHAALKDWYAPDKACQERLVDGFIIDAVAGEVLIEIQTRNFGALKPKLAALLPQHPLCIVYPVAVEKWIVRQEAASVTRRKSPRRGRPEDVFRELVYLSDWLAHPNLSLEVLLLRVEEERRADGKGSWRRGGVSIANRRLLEVLEARRFQSPHDLLALLPPSLPMPFTHADLARSGSLPERLCPKITYSLRQLGVIQHSGKRGRSHLFSLIQ
jgi:hypothetical protein